MVKLILLAVSMAWAQPAPRLVAEFSKSKIYQGESVTCHFVLYAPEDRAEVEVAKFPEFRGFWSENTALRQGPILLLPEPRFPGQRRAIVGSYNLLPMMGDSGSVVTPMKVVLRSPFSGGEKILVSEVSPLTILPLPPVPAADKAAFTGGVGAFHLRAESQVIRFFPKDPTSVRYFVTGTGSFPELNHLGVTFPPEVTVISERSFTMGSGAFQTKGFEYVITSDSKASLELPPVKLVYFDPTLKRYTTTQSEPVRLEAMERPPHVDPLETIDLGPTTPQWSAAATSDTFFWRIQAFLGALWIAVALGKAFTVWKRKHEADPRTKLSKRWDALFESVSSDASAWLKTADGLVFETINTFAKRPFLTRQQALRWVRSRWGEKAAEEASNVFTAERASYAPPPQKPAPTPSALQPVLKGLRKTLFSRRRPPRST